jgi:hypothetical protein
LTSRIENETILLILLGLGLVFPEPLPLKPQMKVLRFLTDFGPFALVTLPTGLTTISILLYVDCFRQNADLLRTENKLDQPNLRAELSKDQTKLRTDLTRDQAKLRADVRKDQEQLLESLRQDIGNSSKTK